MLVSCPYCEWSRESPSSEVAEFHYLTHAALTHNLYPYADLSVERRAEIILHLSALLRDACDGLFVGPPRFIFLLFNDEKAFSYSASYETPNLPTLFREVAKSFEADP